MTHGDQPGCAGEHFLQQSYGSQQRANSFYGRQVLDHLNPRMQEFLARMEMVFIATADANGECDSSFRAGDPGFVRVIDAYSVTYPEYRGNGVYASLGNILENPHIGLMFIDFFRDLIGLHINGTARIVDNATIAEETSIEPDHRAERWIWVDVDEAYIHCSKHLPLLERKDRRIHWGTDDVKRKGGDYFGVTADRREQHAERDASPTRP
jgi:predicted pyridoxine 5'-phosphate oxidase superfamily flavin-nucleotide-binding protein